ncbi:hypothetical protein D187_006171 [Cystobacter fuscus DSM 2262]|uniref:Uncharacterized protein n=1 Tax=Cystobacter fuscus (strain ATCC 25194 / DSM 2262 / NBRC 100088 / M29) TaxID=1242864 RepID=S9PMS0_CYSF2|nr:hypothetical protein D187_006171 [Cystobacter fuscus DSM 2262]
MSLGRTCQGGEWTQESAMRGRALGPDGSLLASWKEVHTL